MSLNDFTRRNDRVFQQTTIVFHNCTAKNIAPRPHYTLIADLYFIQLNTSSPVKMSNDARIVDCDSVPNLDEINLVQQQTGHSACKQCTVFSNLGTHSSVI